MIIDYLLSKDGLRISHVNVSANGLRLGRNSGGFAPQSADELFGTFRLELADLTAAIARPEIVNQLLGGIPGIARPEVSLANGEDGGIHIVGSVEALGKRIPITASTRIRVANNRLIVSPFQLRGIPLLGSFPVQLPDLELPLSLPLGLSFTDVTTEPGCLVLSFAGENVTFVPPAPPVTPPPAPPKQVTRPPRPDTTPPPADPAP